MTVLFGKNLKKRRNQRKLSQAKLGELVGKSEQSIRGYEKGTLAPSIDTISALSEALAVPPAALFPTHMLDVDEPEDDEMLNEISDQAILLSQRDRRVVLKVIAALLEDPD